MIRLLLIGMLTWIFAPTEGDEAPPDEEPPVAVESPAGGALQPATEPPVAQEPPRAQVAAPPAEPPPAEPPRAAKEPPPDEERPSAERAPSAEEILKRADEARNPPLDYTMHVTVTSVKPKRATPASATYSVMVKGREKTVIRTLSPKSERGRVLLMNEAGLWAFLPTVSKPLRISLQERLIGEVANGDLARTNFSGDYTPELARVEEEDGREYYVLNLTATREDVTYARVVLWVERGTFRPSKAAFYAVSGRLLKHATFTEYGELGGAERPLKMMITDAVRTGQYSILEYARMTVGELPDKYFTKDYMKKLME